MEMREEQWELPDQPRGMDRAPAADLHLGTLVAVGRLLLVALNLAVIAQLAWLGGELGRTVVGLALAVAIADVAAALFLLRPSWPGRSDGVAMSRAEQRRQERLARRAERGEAG